MLYRKQVQLTAENATHFLPTFKGFLKKGANKILMNEKLLNNIYIYFFSFFALNF